MTILDVQKAALAAEAAGISVVPPKEDGSKAPIGTWKNYQLSRPSAEKIREWYEAGRTGVGFVCGKISGNLENFEFDDLQIYQDFKAAAEATGLGELVARIEDGYCEMTPGGGVHWPMKCEVISRNTKLACKPGPIDTKTGKPTVSTLIETRGEGGFVIVAPSNGKVHPTGKAYRLISGCIETIPTITPEERAALWDLARTFDMMPKAGERKKDKKISGGEGRPGDDFNQRGDWRELLERNGWAWVYRRGEVDFWRRPGKELGISATTNHNGSDLLYIFSSSTSFEIERGYSKFSALAVLEHSGDFQAAAKALGDAGYGEKIEKGERWKQKRKAPAAGASEDGRVEIQVREDDLLVLLNEAWGALGAYNDREKRAFRFGGAAATIEIDEHGDPTIHPLTPEAMRELLANAARWFKIKMIEGIDEETGEETKKARRDDMKPPSDLARIMLATPRAVLPGLNRIVRAPIVAPSGRIILTEGYDPETRTYYVPGGLVVPAVSARPTAEEIQEAVKLFAEDLLGEFPFVEKADLANALALFLLPFAREIIGDHPTPLHLIEKPTPGSGSGLLVEALGLIVRGTPPALMAEGRDDDEWRKRLTSTLLSGPEIVCIDNLRRRLDSSALSLALTARTWEDRLLGVSQNAKLRIRCTWIATGNNPATSSEIARRTVPIRIDPKMDRPWEREGFKHPKLLAWVREERGRLIHAALTLIQAWIMEGRPEGKASLGSYEEWAATIGGILEVAGVEAFLANRARFYERADRETSAWRGFIEAWWGKFSDTEVGVKELFELLDNVSAPCDLGKGSERSQKTRLGDALGGAVDRRFTIEKNTLKVEGAGKNQGAAQYQLVKEDEPCEPCEPYEPLPRTRKNPTKMQTENKNGTEEEEKNNMAGENIEGGKSSQGSQGSPGGKRFGFCQQCGREVEVQPAGRGGWVVTTCNHKQYIKADDPALKVKEVPFA